MRNLVVIGYRDGRREKGSTFDFVPTKELFHLESIAGGTHEVRLGDLKAVFFVRDLEGDFLYDPKNEFGEGAQPPGRKVLVRFSDGEEMLGTTQGYSPERKGFFIVPADLEANNQRVFVVSSAVEQIRFV